MTYLDRYTSLNKVVERHSALACAVKLFYYEIVEAIA
jgi:hypothetical protein